MDDSQWDASEMDTNVQVDIIVVQLLCSRLCHDLAGPAGAIHNGMELIQESDGDDDGALGLVASSVEQLNGRLAFYRLAFGVGGMSGRKPVLSEARDLASSFLKGGRITLDWPDTSGLAGDRDVDQKRFVAAIKLLLNMIIFGAAALPRGGVLEVEFAVTPDDPVGLGVKALGAGAVIKDDMMAALNQGAKPQEDIVSILTAHNVQGFFMQRLAKSLGGKVEVSGGADEVQIAALLND